jgi:Family of unknown function (DUF5677)
MSKHSPSPWKQLARRVYGLSDRILGAIGEAARQKAPSEVYFTIGYIFLQRATNLFNAVLLAMEAQLTRDVTEVLTRTMVDTSFQFWYMSTDPISLAQRYFDYDIVTLHRSRRRLLGIIERETGMTYADLQQHLHQLQNGVEEFKRKYHAPKSALGSWSGKTIQQMASESGQGSAYELVYRYLSDSTHGGMRSASGFRPHYCRDHFDPVILSFCITALRNTVQPLDSRLGGPFSEELHEIEGMLTDLRDGEDYRHAFQLSMKWL